MNLHKDLRIKYLIIRIIKKIPDGVLFYMELCEKLMIPIPCEIKGISVLGGSGLFFSLFLSYDYGSSSDPLCINKYRCIFRYALFHLI